MNKPILYSFRRCPYAIRARMALRYAVIDYEHREVDLKNKPADMLSASPKGTVPVLILKDQVIDESLEVMLWAIARCNNVEWLTGALAEMLVLIHENDNVFKMHLDRYKYASRYEDVNPVYHRKQAEKFLLQLECRLKTNTFLFSDRLQLADVAIFPFIRQFSFVEPERFECSPYPNLRCWLTRILNSSLFLSVMEKYPIYDG